MSQAVEEEPITPEFVRQRREANELAQEQRDIDQLCALVKTNLTRAKLLAALETQGSSPTCDIFFHTDKILPSGKLSKCIPVLEDFLYQLVDRRFYDFIVTCPCLIKLQLSIRQRENVK